MSRIKSIPVGGVRTRVTLKEVIKEKSSSIFRPHFEEIRCRFLVGKQRSSVSTVTNIEKKGVDISWRRRRNGKTGVGISKEAGFRVET